jgi:hypothetical protein
MAPIKAIGQGKKTNKLLGTQLGCASVMSSDFLQNHCSLRNEFVLLAISRVKQKKGSSKVFKKKKKRGNRL